MPRLSCFAVVAIILACTSSVLAQEVTGEQRSAGEALLHTGKGAYDAGRYAAAQRDFEQALARLGRPTIHYDIGQAAERAGDNGRALAAFRDYLSALPNAPNRAEVEARIDLLQTALAEPSPSALSPTAAAETQAGLDPSMLAGAPSRRDGSELWWLWAGIGAVVVGTVVAALVIATSDDPVQPPLHGDVGPAIQTLEVR